MNWTFKAWHVDSGLLRARSKKCGYVYCTLQERVFKMTHAGLCCRAIFMCVGSFSNCIVGTTWHTDVRYNIPTGGNIKSTHILNHCVAESVCDMECVKLTAYQCRCVCLALARTSYAHYWDGAFVWLSGGRGFPRWWPVVRPHGCEPHSSLTSGRSKNPPWKLRSNSSQGAKVKGLSADNPLSLALHSFSIAVRTCAGQWAGPQNICGARTWNPQKWRVPFCEKLNKTSIS